MRRCFSVLIDFGKRLFFSLHWVFFWAFSSLPFFLGVRVWADKSWDTATSILMSGIWKSRFLGWIRGKQDLKEEDHISVQAVLQFLCSSLLTTSFEEQILSMEEQWDNEWKTMEYFQVAFKTSLTIVRMTSVCGWTQMLRPEKKGNHWHTKGKCFSSMWCWWGPTQQCNIANKYQDNSMGKE